MAHSAGCRTVVFAPTASSEMDLRAKNAARALGGNVHRTAGRMLALRFQNSGCDSAIFV